MLDQFISHIYFIKSMKLNLKSINVGVCLSLFLNSSCSFAQIDIINPTSTCLETKYSFTRQGRVEQLFLKKYDTQGNLLSDTKTFSSQFSGNYTEEYIYLYDAKGNNTQITFSHNNVVKNITKKEYGITGKLTQELVFTSDNTSPIKKLIITDSGSEQIFFDKDGVTETVREKIGLDLNGQILTKEVTSANGNLAFSDKYTYFALGKVSRWVHYDAADKVTTITNYDYDTAGKLLKETTLRNDVLYASTVNTYDSKGNLEKKTRLNSQNKVDYYFTYEYNSKGLLIKENYFYNNQLLSIRDFGHDANGNIIKELYSDSKGTSTSQKEWEFLCK